MYFKKRIYYTYESIEEVSNRIKDISGGFFTGPNLWAREIGENSFILGQKFSFTIFYGSPAKIEATLIQDDDHTKIQVLFRISYRALTAQIFLCCLFVFGCFHFRVDTDKALMYIFVSLVGLLTVHIFHKIALKRLQNLFESALGIA